MRLHISMRPHFGLECGEKTQCEGGILILLSVSEYVCVRVYNMSFMMHLTSHFNQHTHMSSFHASSIVSVTSAATACCGLFLKLWAFFFFAS